MVPGTIYSQLGGGGLDLGEGVDDVLDALLAGPEDVLVEVDGLAQRRFSATGKLMLAGSSRSAYSTATGSRESDGWKSSYRLIGGYWISAGMPSASSASTIRSLPAPANASGSIAKMNR